MERALYTYGVIMLMAAASLAGYTWIDWAQIDGDGWAVWVQAIGSITAIGAAIWISRRDQRRRNAEALVIAKVSAASITFRIASISSDLKKLVATFDSIHKIDGSPNHFFDSLVVLKEQPSWDPSELALLAPLPNGCAYKVAGGLDRLATAIRLIDAAVKNEKIKWSNDFRRERAGIVSFTLNEAALSFERAAEMMQAEIHGHTSPYE
ncbi:MAG: hypothetical protein Q7T66_07100 [Herminiimonas sp.]|uniref:hypothetical protein n=1 Tax=Herminiimonas sp. TaxID=1926289 RepID=UPI002726BEB5|nr:hypothetical protein [Herminiimonas sp.]MDO9420410.1 hypothetical protein [Herminiimonas sp.]